MLVASPLFFNPVIQQLLLVLIITLFTVVLAASELADIAWLPKVRKHVFEFMPVFLVLIVLVFGVIIKHLMK
jgi:hypothetical protein